MSKKLLYLEDNGYLRRQTQRFLEEDGYEVISVSRIDEAIERLETADEIDCIITDLNMEDEWLGQYRPESYGGLFSGWVWLMRFVYVEERFRHIPSIIYSGYITDLENYLRERNGYYLLRKYPISCVKKGGNKGNGYKALVLRLEEIIP